MCKVLHSLNQEIAVLQASASRIGSHRGPSATTWKLRKEFTKAERGKKAAWLSGLHLWNERPQQGGKLSFDALADFQYFGVIDRLIENSCCHVGHYGKRKHFHTAVARHYYFCDRGHAYDVCTYGSEKSDLRRRLIARPRHSSVNSLEDVNALAITFSERELSEFLRVRLRHIGKARTKAIFVRANQCIRALQVDVVTDYYEASRFELRTYAACGVGQQYTLNSKSAENPHWECDAQHAMAFIVMHAALHGCHAYIPHPADHQIAGVSFSA